MSKSEHPWDPKAVYQHPDAYEERIAELLAERNKAVDLLARAADRERRLSRQKEFVYGAWTEMGLVADALRDTLDASLAAGEVMLKKLAQTKEEIEVSERIIADRDRILDALPCPVHGRCVPHVLEKLTEWRKALVGIEACVGFCPDHLGADNYEDPGIILAQEIIDRMRTTATDALK